MTLPVRPNRVAVSASGSSVVAALSDRILIWSRWQDGSDPRVVPTDGPVRSLDCSDTHVVALGNGPLLFDGERMARAAEIDTHGARQVNLSGDGRMLAILYDDRIEVRDVWSGTVLARLACPRSAVARVGFNLETTRLIGAAGRRLVGRVERRGRGAAVTAGGLAVRQRRHVAGRRSPWT